MIIYAERRNGVIVGLYRAKQPGYAEEAIDDGDAEVVAFRVPPVAPSIPERVALLAAAATAISDINTYLVIADTATLAQARVAIKQLAVDMKLVIQRLVQVG